MKLKLNIVLYRQRQSSRPDLIETDALQIFLAAVENSKPVIGVRGTKKGGKVYQVSIIEPRFTQATFGAISKALFVTHTLQPAAISELSEILLGLL